ncbi:MAG: hypothetical protein ACYTAO_03630 [Planctomycetota bacterium]
MLFQCSMGKRVAHPTLLCSRTMDFTETITENTLRAIRFERPDHIPMTFWINPACWHHYPQDALFELMAAHPLLFGDFTSQESALPELDPWERAGAPYTDAWGCVWQTTDDGITGSVTQHALSNWSALESFTPLDPTRTNGMTAIDWAAIENKILKAKKEGKHVAGSLEHGHAFLRLSYLRGYENLLLDMADSSKWSNPSAWQLSGDTLISAPR